MDVTGPYQHEAVPSIAANRKADSWVPTMLVGLLAAVLSFPRLGSFGLWADEGFSVSTSLRPWGDLFRLSVEQETNGALYAWFLKIWALGGTSEAWLRFPSALSFVLTAGLTCVLGRRLHSSTAGAVAGVAVCVHGSLLQYAQNIRFYAPVTAVAVAFVVCWHRVIERKTTQRVAALAVLGLCLPLLHLVAGTLLIGAAAVWWLVRDRFQLRAALLILFPGMCVLVGVAALVSSRNEGQSINQPLGVAAVVDVIYSLTGSNGMLGALSYGLTAILALATIRRTITRRVEAGGRASDIYLPWVFVVTSMMLVSAGSLFTTLMVGRYVLFLVPVLIVGISVGVTDVAMDVVTGPVLRTGLSSQRRLGGVVLPAAGPQPWSGGRLISVAGMAAILALGSIGAGVGGARWVFRSDQEEWRTLSAALLTQGESADTVLFANDSIRLFVEYQLLQHPEELRSAPSSLFPSQPWGQYRTGDQQYLPFEAGDVERAFASHDRVWLVVERPLVEGELAGLLHTLRQRPPAVNETFGRAGTLYRFDRVDADQ